MKLVWSTFAMHDREGIFEHIETENPRAAIAIDERIATATQHLLDFPESGRIGRIPSTRELVIVGTPYIAAYAFSADTVRILRILHGAQIWPDDLLSD